MSQNTHKCHVTHTSLAVRFIQPNVVSLIMYTLICLLVHSRTHRYPEVLYISCNPEAMFDNATRDNDGDGGLSKTHELVRFAVFDHFPYTRHIECGACFVRRRPR